MISYVWVISWIVGREWREQVVKNFTWNRLLCDEKNNTLRSFFSTFLIFFLKFKKIWFENHKFLVEKQVFSNEFF